MKKIYQDSTFYLIIFIISYFIYIYPFEILNNLLFNESFSNNTSLYCTLIIGGLIILYFRTKITFYPLKIFIYEGLGIGFLSFWIMNLALITKYLSNFNSFLIGFFSLLIIILLTFYSLINAKFIKIIKIYLHSSKIKKNYNFIFISDIHLGSNKINHFNKIINKIEKLDYDFIVIGGDLLDSKSFNIENLSILKNINRPIFFVTGNHEYYIFNSDNEISNLNKFNMNILNNKNYLLDEINIIGIDDNIKNHKKIKFVKDLIDQNKYNLLLVHKSTIWENIRNNVDFMLSGHTHNGQIFPFNFFVWLQFKYKYGLYKYKKSSLYVSSGCACWGPKMRLGSSNEIIHINLSSKK